MLSRDAYGSRNPLPASASRVSCSSGIDRQKKYERRQARAWSSRPPPSPLPLSPEGRGENNVPLAPRGRGAGVRGALLWLLLLPAVLLYPCLSFDLFEPDESRYAQIPREMLARGEWVVPSLQGE